MEVETYEVTELLAGPDGQPTPEADAESIALIEKLGLTGQQSLLSGDTEEVERIPYRKMTLEEIRVWSVVCPVHLPMRDYNSGPIPLRVLQVAAHAAEIWDPKKIEVWRPREAVDDDPLLVADVGHRDQFMLARWGTHLLPFETVREKAGELLRIDWRNKLEKHIAEFQAFNGRIETEIQSFLRGNGDYWLLPDCLR